MLQCCCCWFFFFLSFHQQRKLNPLWVHHETFKRIGSSKNLVDRFADKECKKNRCQWWWNPFNQQFQFIRLYQYFCILIWCDCSVDKIFISLSTEISNYGTKNCLRSVYDMVVTNDRNKEQKNIYIG